MRCTDNPWFENLIYFFLQNSIMNNIMGDNITITKIMFIDGPYIECS
jgi:hypothetical protein